jgi:hypothetical protein
LGEDEKTPILDDSSGKIAAPVAADAQETKSGCAAFAGASVSLHPIITDLNGLVLGSVARARMAGSILICLAGETVLAEIVQTEIVQDNHARTFQPMMADARSSDPTLCAVLSRASDGLNPSLATQAASVRQEGITP